MVFQQIIYLTIKRITSGSYCGPLPEQVALVCSEVMPTMLLSSLTECVCFFLSGNSFVGNLQNVP